MIDTNVVVSRSLSPSGTPARVLAAWQRGSFHLVVSEPLLVEYRRALGYEHVRSRHRLTDDELDELVAEIRRSAILVQPTERLTVIEDDEDDNRILECAVEGGAEYVVSGDKHLLGLREYRGIYIVSPAQLLAVLEES